MYTRIQGMQEILAERITIPTFYSTLPNTGPYTSQRGVAYRRSKSNRVVTGYNTTWVMTTTTGTDEVSLPTTFMFHKINTQNQSVVTASIAAPPQGAVNTLFGQYLLGIRSVTDDAIVSGVISGGNLKVVGMRGTTPFSAMYNVDNQFTLPAVGPDDKSSYVDSCVVNTGNGTLAAIAYKGVFIKATDMYYEQIVKVTDSGAVSFILNHSFKRTSTAPITLTADFADLQECGPNHYLFRENPEKTSSLGQNGYLNPTSVTHIVDGRTGSDVWSSSVAGWSVPSVYSTIHEELYRVRLNQTLLTRDYLGPNEGEFIGGRFISVIREGSGQYKVLCTSSGGTFIVINIDIPLSPTGVPYTYRLPLGITPSGQAILVFDDSQGNELLVCYDTDGSEKWQISNNDWPAFDRLISKLILSWRSTAGTAITPALSYDGQGNASISSVYFEATSTTGSTRAPLMRYLFRLSDGNMYDTKSLYNLSPSSSLQQAPLGIFYTYDEETLACQENVLIGNTGSTYATENTTALSGALKILKVPISTRMHFIISDERGQLIDSFNYSVEAKIDGWSEWGDSVDPGRYSLQVASGAEYDITFLGKMYQPVNLKGTYSKVTTPNPIQITLPDKDWSRKDYYVSTQQDVLDIRNDPMGNYNFANDIDMSGVSYETPFISQDEAFMGVINGNGYTLSNLQASGPSSGSYGGLIGIAQNAQFVDITVTGARSESSAGHGLGLVVGYYIKEQLFSDDEIIPSTYYELEPLFKNITIEDSVVKTQWGHSGIGMLIGVFYWRGYLETLDYVFEQITLRRNTTVGTNSGSSNVGPVIGQMTIENINGGGGPE